MKKIIFIAGDRSGDLYGSLVAKHLKDKFPSFKLYSCGGDNLAGHCQQIVNLLDHSVSGLVEVLASLKRIIGIFNTISAAIEKIDPDLIIPIDFPDFNLRLLKKLNKRYPVFYYVSPQIWAWRKKRINLLKKYVNAMVVIFKFEEDFYQKEGIDALYFGHPLLEIINDVSLPAEKIISFLPGSRKNEVAMHLEVMMRAKDILMKKFPDFSFQIIRPKNLDESIYEKFAAGTPIRLHSHEILKKSKFIIAACGTATVEIAILGIPYIIIYRVNPITWWLLKRLVKTKFAGMVNILRSREIVKELLQSEATAEKIAHYSCLYLNDTGMYNRLKDELAATRDLLAPGGASQRFADYIGNFLLKKN